MTRKLFFVGTIIATLSFTIAVLLGGVLGLNTKWIALALTLTGAHQVSTLYYYFDRSALMSMSQRVIDFFVIPIAIIVAITSLYFVLDDTGRFYFLIVYGSITVWHYQKQNVGFFSLTCATLRQESMQKFERIAIMVGGAAAVLALPSGPMGGSEPLANSIFSSHLSVFNEIGAVGLCLALLIALYASFEAKKKWSGTRSLRILMLLLFTGFFWPIFFVKDTALAFAMYGGAHGIQYFFITGLVASSQDREVRSRQTRLLGLIFSCAVTILAFMIWRGFSGLRQPLFGLTADEVKNILLGVTFSISYIHYFVDSRLWKMRHPDARKFLMNRLDFLFPPQNFATTQIVWPQYKRQLRPYMIVYLLIAVCLSGLAVLPLL